MKDTGQSEVRSIAGEGGRLGRIIVAKDGDERKVFLSFTKAGLASEDQTKGVFLCVRRLRGKDGVGPGLVLVRQARNVRRRRRFGDVVGKGGGSGCDVDGGAKRVEVKYSDVLVSCVLSEAGK